jgi:hypothetical protein
MKPVPAHPVRSMAYGWRHRLEPTEIAGVWACVLYRLGALHDSSLAASASGRVCTDGFGTLPTLNPTSRPFPTSPCWQLGQKQSNFRALLRVTQSTNKKRIAFPERVCQLYALTRKFAPRTSFKSIDRSLFPTLASPNRPRVMALIGR